MCRVVVAGVRRGLGSAGAERELHPERCGGERRGCAEKPPAREFRHV
jgi:hypothetical protein